jgi:hypothetical protein
VNHDQLVSLLERERISYPDQLEAERYAPEPAERGYWNHPTISGQDEG